MGEVVRMAASLALKHNTTPRGAAAVNRLSRIEGTEIVALCDLNSERINNCQKTLKDNKRKEAVVYTGEEGWKKMCEREDID